MATDKDRDKRATQEGITESLSESGLLHDVVEDTFDELNEGRKFVKTKQATRDGLREGLSGQSAAGNAIKDTVDEIAHGRAYVKQKEYFREVGREMRTSRDGRGGAKGGLLASFTQATGVPWLTFVILVVVGSSLVWLNQKRDYSKPSDTPPGTPAAVSISTGSGPTAPTASLQVGFVTTCSAVRAWRDYTAKSEFLPGEELFVYAEALDVNHGGHINIAFNDAVVAQSGAEIARAIVPVTVATNDSSWATWQRFALPADAQPGSYTATVTVRDFFTAVSASQSVTFTVPEVNQLPTEEAHGAGIGAASLPSGSHQDSTDCYGGTWQENEINQFTWFFERQGNVLRIRRNDGFVSGAFQKSPEGWTGSLNWGNGTRWDGVVLHDANDACNEITTNQRWWYKR